VNAARGGVIFVDQQNSGGYRSHQYFDIYQFRIGI